MMSMVDERFRGGITRRGGGRGLTKLALLAALAVSAAYNTEALNRFVFSVKGPPGVGPAN